MPRLRHWPPLVHEFSNDKLRSELVRCLTILAKPRTRLDRVYTLREVWEHERERAFTETYTTRLAWERMLRRQRAA